MEHFAWWNVQHGIDCDSNRFLQLSWILCFACFPGLTVNWLMFTAIESPSVLNGKNFSVVVVFFLTHQRLTVPCRQYSIMFEVQVRDGFWFQRQRLLTGTEDAVAVSSGCAAHQRVGVWDHAVLLPHLFWDATQWWVVRHKHLHPLWWIVRHKHLRY